MGLLNDLKAKGTQLAAQANTSLSGVQGGPGGGNKQAEPLLHDLGLITYLELAGRADASTEAEKQRVLTSLGQIEGQSGALQLTLKSVAPPPPGAMAAPPAPGANAAPPAPGANAAPPAPGGMAPPPAPGGMAPPPAPGGMAPPPAPGAVAPPPAPGGMAEAAPVSVPEPAVDQEPTAAPPAPGVVTPPPPPGTMG